MTTGTKVEESKAKRTRSPNYPGINLETAINRAKQFYGLEKRNPAAIEITVKHWGFRLGSGPGLVTLAALRAFGLIADIGSGTGRKVQLTDLALRIILDERNVSKERDEAIKQAALMPNIHAALWQKYQTSLPSEENLRHELIFERKFNENAVNDFIKEYKETIKFAKLIDSDTISSPEEDSEETNNPVEAQMLQNQPVEQQKQPLLQTKVIPSAKPVGASIPVTKHCSMSIMAVGDVTQKGLEQLISYLNLIKGSFPEDETGSN